MHFDTFGRLLRYRPRVYNILFWVSIRTLIMKYSSRWPPDRSPAIDSSPRVGVRNVTKLCYYVPIIMSYVIIYEHATHNAPLNAAETLWRGNSRIVHTQRGLIRVGLQQKFFDSWLRGILRHGDGILCKNFYAKILMGGGEGADYQGRDTDTAATHWYASRGFLNFYFFSFTQSCLQYDIWHPLSHLIHCISFLLLSLSLCLCVSLFLSLSNFRLLPFSEFRNSHCSPSIFLPGHNVFFCFFIIETYIFVYIIFT